MQHVLQSSVARKCKEQCLSLKVESNCKYMVNALYYIVYDFTETLFTLKVSYSSTVHT